MGCSWRCWSPSSRSQSTADRQGWGKAEVTQCTATGTRIVPYGRTWMASVNRIRGPTSGYQNGWIWSHQSWSLAPPVAKFGCPYPHCTTSSHRPLLMKSWRAGGASAIPCAGSSGHAESCVRGWQGCVPPSTHSLPVCLPALCQVHQGHTECGAGLRGPAGKSDTSRVTKVHNFGAGPDLTLLFSAGHGAGFPTHPWPSSCPASSQTTGIVPGLQGTVGPPEPGREVSSHSPEQGWPEVHSPRALSSSA